MDNNETPEQNETSFEEFNISATTIAAIQIHELFLSLKTAGFSHADALSIVSKLVSDAAGSADK